MTQARKSWTSPIVKIDVTQDIIDDSCRRDSSHCMIAEALRQQLPTATYISVDLATIRFSDPEAGRRYIYLTPRRAQEEILNFDQGEKSEPFSFRLQGAHVLPTGSARARVRLEDENNSSTQKKIPTRVGGKAAPIGPLADGPANKPSGKPNLRKGGIGRTGQRREFGIRAIIR